MQYHLHVHDSHTPSVPQKTGLTFSSRIIIFATTSVLTVRASVGVLPALARLTECFEHAVSSSIVADRRQPSFSTQESAQRRSLAGPPGRWDKSRLDPSRESSFLIRAQTFRSASVKADGDSDSLGVERMAKSASSTSGLFLAGRHPIFDCDHVTLRHHKHQGACSALLGGRALTKVIM